MIDLTPLEVRKKKGDFRKGMRGYDPQSVDDFLDVVADRLEQLVRDNAAMMDRLKRAEDQVSDYRERERALTEALVTAQEMREQMRQQIEKEVELKRREAQADADNIRNEAEQMREREEESVRRLRARQSQFVQSYRAFLERELTELAVMTESLDFSRTVNPPAPTRRTRKRSAENAPEPQAAAPEVSPQVSQPQAPQPEPEPSFINAPDFEREPDFERDPDFEREGPAPKARPIPMPLPQAIIETAPPVDERSLDDMIGDLSAFQSGRPAKQLEIKTDEFVPDEIPQAEADAEAELLADVRAEFDEAASAPLDEEEVLDLVDDVADDEPADGWVSTLLEGKGDQRGK